MLTTDEKRWAIEAIKTFFYEERGEELGLIASENVLQFFVDSLGPLVYNRAISDVKQTVLSQFETIDEAVEVLKKPIHSSR